MVVALSRDKPLGLLKVLLDGVDRTVCTSVGTGPYRSPEELREAAESIGRAAEAESEPARALERAIAIAAPSGWVLAVGSLHLAGRLRPWLRCEETK